MCLAARRAYHAGRSAAASPDVASTVALREAGGGGWQQGQTCDSDRLLHDSDSESRVSGRRAGRGATQR